MSTTGSPVAEPTIRIDPLQPQHLDRVVAIEAEVHARPWTRGLFETELAQPSRTYVVAVGEGASGGVGGSTGGGDPHVLAYGGVMLALDEAHITTVVVDPSARRRGIASRIMVSLMDIARDRDAAAATLEVGAANRGAQRLYASFGFAPVGVRPRYYEATGEDAIIMWAYDLRGPELTDRLQRRRDALGLLANPAGVLG